MFRKRTYEVKSNSFRRTIALRLRLYKDYGISSMWNTMTFTFRVEIRDSTELANFNYEVKQFNCQYKEV